MTERRILATATDKQHTRSPKNRQPSFCHNFITYRCDFKNSVTSAVNSNFVIIKHPTTPHTLRYTTLRNTGTNRRHDSVNQTVHRLKRTWPYQMSWHWTKKTSHKLIIQYNRHCWIIHRATIVIWSAWRDAMLKNWLISDTVVLVSE